MKKRTKTVLGYTLGCRLNQADTALIFSRLEKEGYKVVKPGEIKEPDLIIVNTCTVTANAAQKSRQSARSFRKKYPDACIVVSGCDCEKGIGEWEKEPAVDLIIKNKEKKDIALIVAEWKNKRKSYEFCDKEKSFSKSHVNPEKLLGDKDIIENQQKFGTNPIDVSFRENAVADYPFKTRAFLKIQEGCNTFCTYCIVPYVRGRERSRQFEEVLDEARAFIDKGHREIVITGVNISNYRDGRIRIADLIGKLIELPGDFRIRLSSMEPHPENKLLLDLISSSGKLCRFLHIPLQHGTDTILKSMGRQYSAFEFAEFMNYASAKVPGIHLGTDLIVGFPGESDDLFKKSCEFLSSLPIANTHIFRFSPRKGTPAFDFKDKIPQIIAKKRAEKLQKITNQMKQKFFNSQRGEKMQVLIENQLDDGSFVGWSDNYIRVKLVGNYFAIGQLTDCIF